MTDYYEINYEKNMRMLEIAADYCRCSFSREDIINELYNDDDLKKQICLIELSCINSQKDAGILVFNLTGHSGPIRETASFKILELIKQFKYGKFFQTRSIFDAFIQAVTDINPSVSRNACEIIKYADEHEYIYEKIIQAVQKILSETNGIKQNRSYASNKKNFALYWLLEAVSGLNTADVNTKQLHEILSETILFRDYTIREKTAKTAQAFNMPDILKMLENDENIYVRNYTRTEQ